MIDTTEPVELTRAGCLRLLGTRSLGRVVFTASALPAVQPVSYTMDGEQVVFRVVDGGPLSTATRHSVVGFQVDDIDPVSHVGWTVLGVGQARAVPRTDRGVLPADRTGSHTVALPLQQLTGQRVRVAAGRTPIVRPAPGTA